MLQLWRTIWLVWLLVGMIPAHAGAVQPLVFAYVIDPTTSLSSEERGLSLQGELAQMMAADLNIEIAVAKCPFARCLKMLESKEADMITSVIRTPEREAFLHFLDPPMYQFDSAFAFYTQRNNSVNVKTYEDLKDLSIGYLQGAVSYARFDRDQQLKKVPVLTEGSLIQHLIRGRVDVIMSVENTFDLSLQRTGQQNLVRKLTYKEAQPISSYVAMAKGSSKLHLAPQIESWLTNNCINGRLPRLLKRFGIHSELAIQATQ